jgi:Flp pilus assembly CpaE family ATPase
VLIVFQLAVKDIRTTRAMMTALAERGVRPEQTLTVANRYEKRSGNVIAYEDAKRALGGHSPFKVRNDFKSAIEGINFGRPLNQSAPRSALRSDLRELASELHKTFAKRPVLTAGN